MPLVFMVIIFTVILIQTRTLYGENTPSTAGPGAQAKVAAPDGSGESILLDPVIVSAPRLPSDMVGIPAAVTVVEMKEVGPGKPLVTLDDALVRVPGVQLSNRFNLAQDLRISIRGFGARSAFGIRGIQLLVDGLPYTLPDGQTQIDSVDPEAVERVEVMRGPVAALYGNSSGGVINLVTPSWADKPFLKVRTILGEYGLVKTVLQGGGNSKRANVFFNLSRLEMDGFREQSRAESWKLNGKAIYDLDDYSDLTFSVSYLRSPRLEDPGGLTLQQKDADPRRASPLSLTFDTGEEVTEGRGGLTFRRVLPQNQNLEAVAYFGLRHLDNAVPFRFVELDRRFFGGGIKYDLILEPLGFKNHLFSGLDFQGQNDHRRNFDNRGGAPGETLLLDQEERVTSLGYYVQNDVALTEKLALVAGGRYDYVRFGIDDRLVADGNDSGSKTFDQVTGRLGLSYLLRPRVQLYANVAQSFETPTATELVNRPEGGGGINPEIKPQKAVNYEIGFKGSGEGGFSCSLAFFHIRLEDELIPFRDSTDRVFYRNAGKSRRTGVEAGIEQQLAEGLKARLAYTWLDAKFASYEKNGENLKGNRVPGLPEHQLFGDIFYSHPAGVYAGIDFLYAAPSFVDDENMLEAEGYTLVNLRTGYEKRVGKWTLSPFFGVQNLLDQSYSGNVRINANGGRYFEPAPGMNVYGGMGIGYRF